MPVSNYGDLLNNPLIEGMRVYTEHTIERTGFNADASIIVFGRGVFKGPSDRALIYPVDANSFFVGVAGYTNTLTKESSYSLDSNGYMGYPPKFELAYLLRGAIAVKIDGPVTAQTSPVFCRFTGGEKGVFRADADAAKAIAIPNAKFLESGVAGDIVPLSLNLV